MRIGADRVGLVAALLAGAACAGFAGVPHAALAIVPAQPAPVASAAGAIAGAVKALELRRFRALAEADYPALDALLGDDLVYTHSTGKVDTKDSYLQPLRSGRTRYREVEPSDLKVSVYGATAVITGTLCTMALVDGRESRTLLRYTDVWVRRDGRWQLVAWQATGGPQSDCRLQISQSHDCNCSIARLLDCSIA